MYWVERRALAIPLLLFFGNAHQAEQRILLHIDV